MAGQFELAEGLVGCWPTGSRDRLTAGVHGEDRPWDRKRLTVHVVSLGCTHWNFRASVPEDCEDRLGFEVYASLEDRFGAAPGVAAAIFEDRQTCLVCAEPATSTAALHTRLQAVLDAAVLDAAESGHRHT